MTPWRMTLAVLLSAVLSGAPVTALALSRHPDPQPRDSRWQAPGVQIAILLDTSNSMDGLIEQAKGQLWKIVNEFAYARQNGQTPRVEVALYEYGNDNLSSWRNYVRQIVPFTTDLDRISQELFALRTRGGQEYCGAAIGDAVNALDWDRQSQTYKAIFIAGNEPFTQGPVNFRNAIARAVDRGILVNTIFCGDRQEGLSTDWQSGALAGRGTYLNIDHTYRVNVDPTPYDDELLRLSQKLNDTFIAYREEGRAAFAQTKNADVAALSMASSGAAQERAAYKISRQASAPAWDLVSRVERSPAFLMEAKAKDLPEDLRGKSQEELKKEIDKRLADRQQIQKDVAALTTKRDAYLAARPKSGPESLDSALIRTLRDQAGQKGFLFGR